jgi:hypothetical protein
VNTSQRVGLALVFLAGAATVFLILRALGWRP